MRIGIGSDHAGFTYKQMLIAMLRERGHEVVDFGTDSTESVDYPTYIRPVALAVAAADCERGIVLGGSGNGEAIVANRVKGVRCALCSLMCDSPTWYGNHHLLGTIQATQDVP